MILQLCSFLLYNLLWQITLDGSYLTTSEWVICDIYTGVCIGNTGYRHSHYFNPVNPNLSDDFRESYMWYCGFYLWLCCIRSANQGSLRVKQKLWEKSEPYNYTSDNISIGLILYVSNYGSDSGLKVVAQSRIALVISPWTSNEFFTRIAWHWSPSRAYLSNCIALHITTGSSFTTCAHVHFYLFLCVLLQRSIKIVKIDRHQFDWSLLNKHTW